MTGRRGPRTRTRLRCGRSIDNIKDHLRASYDHAFLESVDDAAAREGRALASVDFHEGVMSFVERRPPAFAPLGEGGLSRTH